MRSRVNPAVLLAGCLFIPLALTHAEDTLPQKYLAVYVKIHDAENLEKKQDYAGSLKAFQESYASFLEIQKIDPDWETALVGHRMDDCKVTIQRLQNEMASVAAKSPQPIATTNAPPADMVFKTNASPQKQRTNYQWKTGILADKFYIGKKSKKSNVWEEKWGEESEGSNAWNLEWPKGTQGGDTPDWRNGYATGSHAAYFNSFYVALPFNDLAYPDKAKQYLPVSWQRAPKDGKPASSCQNRWVEIKAEDGSGHVCYAQWEDVGPLRSDHAEYIFGPERPDTGNRAGIGLSPAVVEYLGFAEVEKQPTIRWRFVDSEDVPPGVWMKLDEEAVIYTALHQSPELASVSTPVPAPHKEAAAPAALAPGSTKP